MPNRRSMQEARPVESVSWDVVKAGALANIDLEVLGERIRRARLEQKVTQRDLTRGLFTSAYLSSLELGKTRPTFQTLATLAERLDKSLDYFLRPASGTGVVEDQEQSRTLTARFALLELEINLSGEGDQENPQTGRLLEELERLYLSRLAEAEKARFYLLKGRYYRQKGEEALTREALERSREFLASLTGPNKWNEPGAERERVLVAASLEYEEGQVSLSQGKGLAALNHFDRGLEHMAQVSGNPTREAAEPDLSLAEENPENYQDNFKSLFERVRMGELLPRLWLGAGRARLLLGELEEAARAFERAVSRQQALTAQPVTRAGLYDRLARVYLEQGEFLQAGFYLGQASRLLRDKEERQNLVTELGQLAALEVRLGRYAEATEHARQVLSEVRPDTSAASVPGGAPLSTESANAGQAITQLVTLARAEAGQGNVEEALKYVEEGLALSKQFPEDQSLAPLYLVASEVYKRLGKREEAGAYYEQTLHVLEEETGEEAPAGKKPASKTLLAEVYYSYGQSLREWGETAAAFEYLEKAYRLRELAR
ncbi:MAG TPA: tetratricopeptide repeat protein [Chloroflexia bacterium]|nr:tetratricopeptide repeat protein [Chloroflexia bacterium]